MQGVTQRQPAARITWPTPDGCPGYLLPMNSDQLGPGAEVQRCDECAIFSSDDAAAEAAQRDNPGTVVMYRQYRDWLPVPYLLWDDMALGQGVEYRG